MQVDILPDTRHSLSSAGSLEGTLPHKWQPEGRSSLSKLSSFGDSAQQPTADTTAESQASAAASLPEAAVKPEAVAAAAPGDQLLFTASVEGDAEAEKGAGLSTEAAPAAAETSLADGGHAEAEERQEEEAERKQATPLTGLLRYRAPVDPEQRGKLESFDRKIGRAANALHVCPSGVCSFSIFGGGMKDVLPLLSKMVHGAHHKEMLGREHMESRAETYYYLPIVLKESVVSSYTYMPGPSLYELL